MGAIPPKSFVTSRVMGRMAFASAYVCSTCLLSKVHPRWRDEDAMDYV